MNKKEAKQILRKAGNDPDLWDERTAKAEGYLEAIEKAKGLEEALIVISSGNMRPPISRMRANSEHMQGYAKEALAKWEETK